MNKHYVQLDGTTVLATVKTDADMGSGWQEVPQEDVPVRPFEPAQLHWIDGEFVWQDPRTLEEVRADCWEAIKAKRAQALDAPLVTPHGTFNSDAASRIEIANTVQLSQTLVSLGQPADTEFTLLNNQVATLTPSQMVQVGLLLGAKVQGAHATARLLRREIDLATTREEALAVTWPG